MMMNKVIKVDLTFMVHLSMSANSRDFNPREAL